MRILVLMRGIPASGKSTWIANMGLSEYTLSADSLRLMASSPVLLPKSKSNAILSESADSTKSHALDSLAFTGINQQNGNCFLLSLKCVLNKGILQLLMQLIRV